MQLPLVSVALYALKLAYESEGSSPILRDDPAMSDYQRDVFAFDLRKGDMGGAQTVMGRELQTLAAGLSSAQTPEQMHPALLTLKDYLKDVQ